MTQEERWERLVYELECYCELPYALRNEFGQSPRKAWAWLDSQLDQRGWVWTVTNGFTKSHASILGTGDRRFTADAQSPLTALAAAYIAACKAALSAP